MRSKWDRVRKNFKQEVHNNDYSTFEKMVVGQETEWEKNALQTQHKTEKGKDAIYVNEYNNDWESKTAEEQERDAEIWRTISGVYKADRIRAVTLGSNFTARIFCNRLPALYRDIRLLPGRLQDSVSTTFVYLVYG